MATVEMATAAAMPMRHAEEALLDAYDLQWKAIDIRLDQLRNECERMILEYEVEIKQQMYLRECEGLLEQQLAANAALAGDVEREQRRHDELEAQHRREREEERVLSEQQREREREEEARARELERQEAERQREQERERVRKREQERERERERQLEREREKKRKEAQERERAQRRRMEEMQAELEQRQHEAEPATTTSNDASKTMKMAKTKPPQRKSNAKSKSKIGNKSSKSVTIEGDVDDNDSEIGVDAHTEISERGNSTTTTLRKAKSKDAADDAHVSPPPMPLSPPVFDPEEALGNRNDLSVVADDELLQMLSQDHGYESEDYAGDQPSSASLILPESPALKQILFEKSTVQGKTPEPPNHRRVTFPQRLNIVTQPEHEPSSESDGPPPVETPPPKRALKRRKLANNTAAGAKSPATGQARSSGAATQATTAPPPGSTIPAIPINVIPVKATITPEVPVGADSDQSLPIAKSSALIDVGTKKRTTKAGKNDRTNADDTIGTRPDVTSDEEAVMVVAVPQKPQKKPEKSKKKSSNKSPQASSVTGRSKARASAKLAALRAAEAEARELKGISMHDIATPKVPKKKMHTAAEGKKKKEMSDLATKRAEFQKSWSEATRTEDCDASASNASKKRRRGQEADTNSALTPKKKRPKSAFRSTSPMVHDELNILKSPFPIIHAKSKPASSKNKKKRAVSDRDEEDAVEPDYTTPVKPRSKSPSGSTNTSRTPTAKLPTQSSAKKTPSSLSNDAIAAAASDYASRWLNSGLVTRAKKKVAKKQAAAKAPRPASVWGGGPSFFDAFVNTTAPAIPRLKTT